MQINRHALSDFMEGEGLRLTDLSAKSGVSISFLSELRSGSRTEASAATVRKIADALNVRVRSLMANPNESDEQAA
ncbi:MAG TPA: helix-turn-helix transcriptional regulator [Aquihabitans sp.]|jgi:transcriptional regulator with XRE-family HTH domain|nr:helix-turn-helix transcriptional regulator [Aquihabitans sp.]